MEIKDMRMQQTFLQTLEPCVYVHTHEDVRMCADKVCNRKMCVQQVSACTCSWSIGQLCLAIHLTILCGKSDVNEPLGCFLGHVLCWCRSVSTWMVSLCSTNSPTSWFRQAPSQLREVALQRTIEKRVEFVESYLASSFCILLHTTSIEFSCVSDPQTCLCPPKTGPTVSSLHSFVWTISWTPSECTRSISSRLAANTRSSGEYPPLTSSQNLPPPLQDLIMLKRDFWYRACNFLNCIQLIILFELFTKRLQNRCNQFWRVRVQQRSVHLRIHPISPKFPSQCSSKWLSKAILLLQQFVKKKKTLFYEHIHLILVAFFEFLHLHTGPRTKSVWFFCKISHGGFSLRCMSSRMFM